MSRSRDSLRRVATCSLLAALTVALPPALAADATNMPQSSAGASRPDAPASAWSMELDGQIEWLAALDGADPRLVVASAKGGLRLLREADGATLLQLEERENFRRAGECEKIAVLSSRASVLAIHLGDLQDPARVLWRRGGPRAALDDDPEFDNPIVACGVFEAGVLVVRSDGVTALLALQDGGERWRRNLSIGRDARLFARGAEAWLVTRPTSGDVAAIRIAPTGETERFSLGDSPPLWCDITRAGLLTLRVGQWSLISRRASAHAPHVFALAAPPRLSLFALRADQEGHLSFVFGEPDADRIHVVDAKRSADGGWAAHESSSAAQTRGMRFLITDNGRVGVLGTSSAAIRAAGTQEITARMALPAAPLAAAWRGDRLWALDQSGRLAGLDAAGGVLSKALPERLDGDVRIEWAAARVLIIRETRMTAHALPAGRDK